MILLNRFLRFVFFLQSSNVFLEGGFFLYPQYHNFQTSHPIMQVLYIYIYTVYMPIFWFQTKLTHSKKDVFGGNIFLIKTYFPHNYGSGKWLYLKGNYCWKKGQFLTSMIMGGSVSLPKRGPAAFKVLFNATGNSHHLLRRGKHSWPKGRGR